MLRARHHDGAPASPADIVEEEQTHSSTEQSSSEISTLANSRAPSLTEKLKISEDQDGKEIHRLARTFTNESTQLHRQNPFEVRESGPLDPNGPKFNARHWAKAFYNIRTSTADGHSPKVAGLSFKDLHVYGYGSPTDFQMSVGNAFLKLPALVHSLFGGRKQRIDILHGLDGLVRSGETLAVLGPPGSGCSTLLRTIAGDTHGFKVGSESFVNYQGISPEKMRTWFRGEAIYTAEVDDHFPMLSVGDTLYFAALARAPYQLPGNISRQDYARHLRDVIMAMFGIGHTVDTRVGNDFVRGVSGGERKRVTIAEAALSYAPLQCWDNSTRGLDSANAIEFCRTLRTQSDVFGTASCVAIYQAPQEAYNTFDKVTVLYEGRQIFFGKTDTAKAYFENLGFLCPGSQTTPDFLTSMTSPVERVIKPGHANLVPRTADDFAKRWKESPERRSLLVEIDAYNDEHQYDGANYQRFASSRKAEKSGKQREKSPYTLSYYRQIELCMWRELQRLKNDPTIVLVMLFANLFEALIVSSIFYNLPQATSSFYLRGVALFMMVLLNAFGSILEILSLYAKRKIVEKHNRYCLYHPSAEAVSSIIMDLPYKILNSIFINTTLYFMSNLRREPGPFFFYFLVSFTMTMSMSMFFRFFASITKTIAQALAPSSIILLALVLYTGFTIPIPYMRGWAHWIRYVNPIAYGFENVMVNEFHGRDFECSSFVPSGPGYENVSSVQRVCSAVGSVPGSNIVSGTAYVRSSFEYDYANRWRNFGIIVAMTIFLAFCHLITSELVASERSKGEVLVYRRAKMHRVKARESRPDEERTETAGIQTEKFDSEFDTTAKVEQQTSVFQWQNVSYEINIKKQKKLILDRVDGWVKPGTLTALMGVSGAGKTTLLDVLADRTTIGVVTGDMLVDGRPRDDSFQQQTGYVQQQDLHLHTSTVREALKFSALLRQPDNFTYKEKIDYVDQVINLLNMENFADAIVGVPGEGLNVEQRKRLTIGVELVARPKLLLFLDEPTSGLDSQTSWSICNLMEKLTRNGQAILCTIHQPSAMLFQRFDRLLLLAEGGKTVYFGEIGRNSKTLIDYFVRNGGADCPPDANPAEYMLEVIGAAPGAHTDIDWPAVWRDSAEYKQVQQELSVLKTHVADPTSVDRETEQSSYKEFAAPLMTQTFLVSKRVFQQYWRTPSYIYSKALLAVGSSLFIGFSFFRSENSMQGLQNQMFGVFMFLFVTIQLVFQIVPVFALQRTLYEARERQSKTYDWRAFMLSNILVEFAWNSLMGILCFLTWYYPMALWRNSEATDAVHGRSTLVMLIIWVLMLFASSFAHMLIAAPDSDEAASGIANVLFIMMYAFCGVLAGPDQLPGFWIFMYRINPFTYVVDAFLSTSLANAKVTCASNEYLHFQAPNGQTCGEYMTPYITAAGGYLLNESISGTENCEFCPLSSTNQFLAVVNSSFDKRWRNFGIIWAYVAFNIAAAIFLYWAVRVPKGKNKKKQ
ncbi:hypothetical protein AJ80_08905 [Polytolypa hystricis UAMH7299]|uniref:ABC transporter domain-containing protein n=1 Tax=Polytolypa hystricis (strain UAMH7299) TaxID=1447883 RepID=A0A2B7X0D1_POLH7|nr:hypothetical protein AJ80_08905 [Polytolypa hystricis UAMH7299]